MKIVFSLSHTDLDGYGCQYVLSQFYSHISFYNADYGNINDILSEILEIISEGDTLYITDLNLTEDTAKLVHETSKSIGYNIILLDHHITGLEQSKKYDWYNLDSSVCATTLTYNYCSEKFNTKDEQIQNTVQYIDVYDMWRIDSPIFRKSQLLSNIIFDYRMDSIKNTYLMIGLIEQIGILLNVLPVIEIERLIPNIVNSILQNLTQNKSMLNFLTDENIATSVKIGTFPAEDINRYIYCTHYFEEFNADVIFFKDISSKTSQYAFDYLLNSNSYKDKVLVKYDAKNNTLSCRSKNQKAVLIAKHFGGGGHPDAAGANPQYPFEHYLS